MKSFLAALAAALLLGTTTARADEINLIFATGSDQPVLAKIGCPFCIYSFMLLL